MWAHNLSNVKVETLRRFAALAEELNFTRTARTFHISQQVLSSQIKELERQAGFALFERTTHHVALTPGGRSLLTAVRSALETLDAGLRESHDIAGGSGGRLRIGFSAQGGGAIQSQILGDLRDRNPALVVETRSFPFSDPFAGLLKGETDAAFLFHPSAHPDVVTATLQWETRVVLVPESHPLARFTEVTAQQLADLPSIAVRGHQETPILGAWVACHALAEEIGLRPVGVEVETAEEWLHAAREGLGFSTAPASVLDFYLLPGLVGVPVCEVSPLRLALGWRRGREDDPVLRDLLAWGKDAARDAAGLPTS